jgi:hypothetical protein
LYHLLTPYQSEPGPQGASWDEKRLTDRKGSLAERASEKCIQDDLLANQLGARAPHVEVMDLVDWCRKYLYLPCITNDQVILDAPVNSLGALTVDSTFYLCDIFNDGSCRYQGLWPQQSSSNQLPSLKSLIVKEDFASRQSPVQPP